MYFNNCYLITYIIQRNDIYKMSKQIYLDYAASTPLDPRVFEAMSPWMQSNLSANPHSSQHLSGMRAANAVKQARVSIANYIGANFDQLIFTSGATEANNIALQGLKDHLILKGKTHIISSKVEHKSVLNILSFLEKEHGFQVTYLSPKSCGMVEAKAIENALLDNTGLVTIQAVNNEVGVINPLSEISDMLEGRDVLFHVDGAQALGKVEINVRELNIDFLTLSAHKAYGPQGVGALYFKNNILKPLTYGGGQEQGLRSGTLSTALCVGFARACELINLSENDRLLNFRHYIINKLQSSFPNLEVFGHSDDDWQFAGILSLRFPDIDNETLLMTLPDFSIGTGSACGAGKNEPSHVITNIASKEKAFEVIRISFGRFTTQEEIETLCQQLKYSVAEIYSELRKVA